jgi:hypothetical protein
MKISTRKLKFMKLNFMAMLLMMSISFTALGQTIPTPATGDFVSITNGSWSTASTWRIEGGANPATSTPGFGSNVFISSGTTVDITAAASCENLYVNAGGTLRNGNTTYNVLTIGRSLPNGVTESFLINNGTIGSGTSVDVALTNADLLDVQINNTYGTGFPAVSTFTFSGTGSTKVAAISAVGAGTANTKTMTLNLNKPIVLVGLTSNGARTLTLNRLQPVNASNGQSINENYIMNINSTIRIANNGSGSSFNTSGNTLLAGGSYTYNINGTLDLSRGTATQGFIPFPQSDNINLATNTINTVTLNVSGTYIMGSGGFSTRNNDTGTNFSRVSLNILDGGVVDATKITNVGFGANALALTGAYFNISGPNRTGKLKRSLTSGTNDWVFPIGTPTGYSPVIIRNTGTTGDFTVGVVDNFTGFTTFTSPITNAHTLKNRFTIEAANPTSVIGLLRLGWTANDEGSSFNRTQTLALQKFTSGTWATDANVTTSTVTGTGTASVSQNQNATTPVAADPYLVTLAPTTSPVGVIDLTGNYTISQDISVLPLNLLSFTGKLNEFNKQVELKWITTSEVNTKNFEIQESTDGKNFSIVGTVVAKNTAGIHNYNFEVNTQKSGVLYYKLRQVDQDGKFQFSNVIAVEKNSSLLTVYPNPAEDNLTLSIPEGNTTASVAIYALDGKMVYNKSVSANELISNINISELNTGIYTLVVYKGKESLSQKFIKK